MLKRFFISMLGAMAGLWLSFLIFGIVLVVAIGILIGSAASKTVNVDDNSVLHLCLEGEIVERQPEFGVQDLLNFDLKNGQTLSDMISAVRLAANDKKIKGIYIEGKGSTMGIASRTELIEAIEQFKESGKWVIAYADNFTQGDYYVASVADKVYLNPVGMLDVHGLAATIMFYKNLLDKLGVEVQVVKVGDYKSAVEPYIRTDMSAPSREQTTVFINQIWGDVAKRIAKARQTEMKDVDNWADSLSMTWNPETYVEKGMVNDLLYRCDVVNLLKDKLNVDDDKDLPLVTPADYMAANDNKLASSNKKHIAVLYAVGDIVDDGEGGIVATKIVPEIEKLTKDDNVAGLVLRVNSPGGSAFASEQIWKALDNFKSTGRRFVVSMGDYAASGGYYISCAADVIYADASTLTGSIGIFGLIPNVKGLVTDKIGVNVQTVASNPNADFPTILAPMTPMQAAGMQKYVERGYSTFTKHVAEGRGLPVDSVYAIGGGRVWDGSTALTIGLVDKIGSLAMAVEDMASELGLSSKDYVCYPSVKDKWMSLLMDNFEETGANAVEAELKKSIELAKRITSLAPVQARMEPIIIE